MSSILSIIKNVLALVVRFFGRKDNPVIQTQNEREQFQKAAVSGDENTVNSVIADDLARLRDGKSSSDSK